MWLGPELTFEGIDNIPAHGPLLLVSNHLSNVDPFIFGGYAPGTMFCMAKRELFTNPVLGWILGGCNCYPVDRGAADRWALRTSLNLLKDGARILIFLEGTRARTPGMQRAEPGIGFLARRSGAPVLPVAVWGTERATARHGRLPRRARVHVRYGTPFQPELASGRRHDDQAVADTIGRRIAELLPEQYQGVYAAT